ncbi:MAG: mannose-1-phosphate guanylyltransferase [Pirellulales bacterium]|nr:mannose-1-phosphate guanylyltransferase [Pirellulales bacterium]
MLHAVIMAGGAGTRFWPESRIHRPKQVVDMLGGRTMIQATVDRLGNLVPPERTYVATTAVLAEQIAEQLPQLSAEALIVEPCKRDTAPCIGLAAARVLRDDPDAVMALMPSDHVIEPDEIFREAIRFASALVEEDPKRLVTFGIRPTYPAETFGYIERAAPLSGEPHPAYAVKKFHEKPKADVAKQYVESGKFYWNSGIFVWRADTILQAIAQFQPKMIEHLERIAEAAGLPKADEVLKREFAQIEPISIDLGVMEHASNVVVVEAPFGWDDMGSWRAMERLRETDSHGNVIDVAKYLGLNTTGSVIRSRQPNHLVVTMGVDDLVIVVTPDATLVANKNDEESIRQITRELQERGWTEYL